MSVQAPSPSQTARPEEKAKKPDPLEYLSATRLKTFQECRLKFFFRYVEALPVREVPALFIGKVTHAILQRWNLNRWRSLPADSKSLYPVYLELWKQTQPKGLDWEDKEEEQRAKTWNMIEFYLANTPICHGDKLEGVEVTVERDLDAHGLPPLKGMIDLVRQGGVIVDFKTSARTPEQGMAVHLHEVQLGCYALLYREATGKTEGGFELHHLVKTKEPKLVVSPLPAMDRAQIQRLVRIMESYVRGVQAKDYVPSPGQHCAWCDFYRECRAWSPVKGS